MRQILELGEFGKLNVERVDYNPTVDRECEEDEPEGDHQTVVGEDVIVHYIREQIRQDSEQTKHKESIQPGNHLLLMLHAYFQHKQIHMRIHDIRNVLIQEEPLYGNRYQIY